MQVEAEACARGGTLVVAAADGGEVAGYAVLRRASLALAVVKLVVAPHHRRRGIGRRKLLLRSDESCESVSGQRASHGSGGGSRSGRVSRRGALQGWRCGGGGSNRLTEDRRTGRHRRVIELCTRLLCSNRGTTCGGG